MDPEPTPELNEALKTWRAGLTGLAPDDVAELEGHLCDSMAELRASGLTEAEAFEVAAARLGSPGELAAALGAKEAGAQPAGGPSGVAPTGCWRVAGWSLVGLGWVVMGLAALLVWVALRPVEYDGRVVMELAPQVVLGVTDPAAGRRGDSSVPRTHDERVAREGEHVRSEAVLRPVVEGQDLVRRWKLASPAEAVATLREKVTFEPERGTDLVMLTVTSRDRKEAAALANAVAASYQTHTSDEWRRGWEGRKEAMKKLLEEKTAAVESARQELLRVVQLHGITEVESGSERADEVAQPVEGQSSEVLPEAEPGRWEAGRAKQAYRTAQAALADARETMARVAQIERPLTIHEFATEWPDYSKKGDRQRYGVAGALGLLALSLLALGRWMVRNSRGRMRRA